MTLPDTCRTADAIFADMHETLGKPPIMLVDNWPIVPPMVIVASHEVAEQISRSSKDFQYSAPKSPSVDRIMDLIGPNSILFKQVRLIPSLPRQFSPLDIADSSPRTTSGSWSGRGSIQASRPNT